MMKPHRTIIAALTNDRVIGVWGRIPWLWSADLRRFKRLTEECDVIMGRKTWESLPPHLRPLPNRRNFVITNRDWPTIEQGVVFRSLERALEVAGPRVWFIGGAQLYQAALKHADTIDLTWVPDVIPVSSITTLFPEIPPEDWDAGPRTKHPWDSRLELQQFTRKEVKRG